ncbi:DUF1214 domain-containing protein [Flammeovirga yaeyamensis]|uniref:DUF1214 domain-containing protein n=1 Tax=Flammeovirga yaeyamensis TaxID=367791 RepID=A0AAX1NCP3_9BACT|nr:DUF1214 domain-containing protein [Flammeovirga yaeyamensis]MBB3696832.1 hypothetical protein [Flammeovirga yaeyamensis]NMF33497.1 DUF1254 domain-containing protein [Flammeovirga yaeyamensis]QWG05230.1 DUF1214 domain-containing protein [Flammeovirga yaeyamensis]
MKISNHYKIIGFLAFLCALIFAYKTPQKEVINELTISNDNQEEAIKLAKWAMPMVSFFSQKEANKRDMGALSNQILYWSKPFDHNNKILTPNDVVLYISTSIETFNGPMVLEIPKEEENIGLFGSILDPFMVPLEDIGGANGIDKGIGAKLLITPPNYDKAISSEYKQIHSEHFNTVAGIRITPKSFDEKDLKDAIDFIHKMKLYPLGSHQETIFVDGGNKPYDPTPKYDETFFQWVDHYIQTENHKTIDSTFIQKMEVVGIKKDKEFFPDDSHKNIAVKVKNELQEGFRNIGNQFFPNSNWTTPVDPVEPATQFTYVDENGNYHWETRAQTFHWAIWAPKHLGKETFYLVGQKDDKNDVLSSQQTYSLTVPANVPARQFWSVNVYELETGGTFFSDVEKVAISSLNEDLLENEDGSVTLTFGPNCPEGYPLSNHVPTVGNGTWFTLFRWYAPSPELFSKDSDRWTLGDFKKL